MYFSPCACAGEGCVFWDGIDCKREEIFKMFNILKVIKVIKNVKM